MAVETSLPPPSPSVDPRSGFCYETKTFHSLRAAVPLPDESLPLSAAAYALSLLPSPFPSNSALIDAATGAAISYPEFVSRVRTLAASLRFRAGLSKGDVAFVLSPTGLDVPLLYFALLSLGVIVSPANPLSTAAEISHQIRLSKPSVAFATAATADKLPRDLPIILLDSPRFRSFLSAAALAAAPRSESQLDTAAILYPSGTTGRGKGVILSPRNFITLIAVLLDRRHEIQPLIEAFFIEFMKLRFGSKDYTFDMYMTRVDVGGGASEGVATGDGDGDGKEEGGIAVASRLSIVTEKDNGRFNVRLP